MKKERREYILGLFRSYEENKRYLKFESTKRESDMSEEEKAHFKELKNKVKVVEQVLFLLEMEDPNKKKFVTEHLIEGKTLRRVSFNCYVTESTLIRWKMRVYEVSESALKRFNL